MCSDLQQQPIKPTKTAIEAMNKLIQSKLITLEYGNMCLKKAYSLLPVVTEKILNDELNNSMNGVTVSDDLDLDSDQETSSNNNNSSPISTSPSSSSLPHLASSTTTKLFDCVWPSKPINLMQLQSLRSSILINICYISLCLKDYVGTIKYCNIILNNDDKFNIQYPIPKGAK
jgi:hypothetical protein